MSVFTWNISRILAGLTLYNVQFSSSAITYGRQKGDRAPVERKCASAIWTIIPTRRPPLTLGQRFYCRFSSVPWFGALLQSLELCVGLRSAGLSWLWVCATGFPAEDVCLGSSVRIAWLLSCSLAFVLCPPSWLYLRFLRWFLVQLFWICCSFLVH